MRRQPNAPRVSDVEISRALAPLEPDAHRRRTAQRIDSDTLRRELALAREAWWARLREACAAWAVRGGVLAGYVALALAAWLAAHR